jgi:DNA-binding transcriptional regulator YiaG
VPSPLRELRRSIDVSQEEFARMLDVALETLRTWDSGRRTPPSYIYIRARAAMAEHQRQHELLSLDELATEFGIHQRTLRDAVRAGRLEVQLSTRSAFGRPIRRATRAAVLAYQQQYYRRSYSRTMRKPPPPPPVDLPADVAERVILARHALRLTLSEFAERIGAANKAVVYQWESGKRRPSPVFWARIAALRDPGR